MTSNRSKEWEKQYEKMWLTEWIYLIGNKKDTRLISNIKSFIQSLLSQQRADLIEKVEGMKKPLVDYPNGQPKDDWLYGRDRGYNQALDDVLQLLKGEK